MAKYNQNHTMRAGETKTIRVTVRNRATGALVSFTSATITWTVKQNSTTLVTKTVGSGITVISTGIFDMTLDTGDTTTASGDYTHEVRGTLADGTVTSMTLGTISIEPTL